jgi:hypothetical protein
VPPPKGSAQWGLRLPSPLDTARLPVVGGVPAEGTRLGHVRVGGRSAR